MRKILVIGAGKSSSALIQYLLENSAKEDWFVTVGDISVETAGEKVGAHDRGKAVEFDINQTQNAAAVIADSDLVISMLPASMHGEVAEMCLNNRKNLLTPSYISPAMAALSKEVEAAGLLFLNELGVDPGIDHMSAMKVIDEVRERGGVFTGFETFTGGLIAPESDDNPWHYKFTWNPRNVVLAGQGVVKFIQEGRYKYIPYHRLFRRTEIISIPEYGDFEGYANRDSLSYRKIYGLEDIKTIYRGTLRRPGFCRSWDSFVQLGATDDSYVITGSKEMTHREFINSFLLYNPTDSVELKLAHYLRLDMDSEEMYKLKWLGIFDSTPIGLPEDATPARILQQILEKKWTLKETDRDMIVMFHKFNYMEAGCPVERHSWMALKGGDRLNTAMALTVGLPLGVAAKLILNGTFKTKGVTLPVIPEIYLPILSELESFGISFHEKVVAPSTDN